MLGRRIGKSLQLKWHGTLNHTDGVETSNRRSIVVGLGKLGGDSVELLSKSIIEQIDRLKIIVKPTLKLDIVIGQTLRAEAPREGFSASGQISFPELKKKLRKIISGIDVVVIVSAMGSISEIETARYIAQASTEEGTTTIAVVSTYSKWRESEEEQRVSAVQELKETVDLLVFMRDKEFHEIIGCSGGDSNLVRHALACLTGSILDLTSHPSLVSDDPNGLKSIVRGQRLEVIGLGESNSKNRAEEAVNNALKDLTMQDKLTKAKGALVHITGDSQMTIEEINRIEEVLMQAMTNDQNIIIGASTFRDFRNGIRVALILAEEEVRGRMQVSTLAPQLFDLEPQAGPERKLNLNLELYQLEAFE